MSSIGHVVTAQLGSGEDRREGERELYLSKGIDY